MTDPAVGALVAAARSHTIADLPRRTAARLPDRLALVDGPKQLTFREFHESVQRCAAALATRGVSSGDRVLLISRNCWQFAVLNFATARLGAIFTPVNFGLEPHEISYLVDHSAPTVVIAQEAFVEVLDAAVSSAQHEPPVRAVITGAKPVPRWESVDAWIEDGGADALPELVVGDDDPVRLMYTSGTESRPKGVLLSSKSLISQYVSCAIDGGMSEGDIEIHALPMYHCAQLDCFLSVDIYLGATSYILPAPDPAAILELIESARATKLFAPPTVWIALLRHPDFDSRDLSSLRKCYYGAAAMPVEVLREINRRLPDVELWNFYGQTELSPVATILGPADQLLRPGSAGRPALNVETRVVDDAGEPLPTGEVGEIVHRTPHATLGYFEDPEKTAEAFAGGWFHSGDLGVFDDEGYLTIVDRKKDMIKTGGENVSSREVEEALYTVDGIAEVAVFAVPHPKWIEAVTAVVVLRPDTTLTSDEISDSLRHRLAGYKQPKYIVIVDELPKNPSGKILKRELRQAHARIADVQPQLGVR